jgi:hypothetical protein
MDRDLMALAMSFWEAELVINSRSFVLMMGGKSPVIQGEARLNRFRSPVNAAARPPTIAPGPELSAMMRGKIAEILR